jgi:hypothetical protein
MVKTYIGNFEAEDLKHAIRRGREVTDPRRLYIDFNGKELDFIVRKHVGDSTINIVVHKVGVRDCDIGEIEKDRIIPQVNGHTFCINVSQYEENNKTRQIAQHRVTGYRDTLPTSVCVSCPANVRR